jgi:hypothetical protein
MKASSRGMTVFNRRALKSEISNPKSEILNLKPNTVIPRMRKMFEKQSYRARNPLDCVFYSGCARSLEICFGAGFKIKFPWSTQHFDFNQSVKGPQVKRCTSYEHPQSRHDGFFCSISKLRVVI